MGDRPPVDLRWLDHVEVHLLLGVLGAMIVGVNGFLVLHYCSIDLPESEGFRREDGEAERVWSR